MNELLSEEQQARYRSEGYLIVPDLLSGEECAAFLDHESHPAASERKLGLRTHTADPAWSTLAKHPRVVSIVEQLMGGAPLIVQTMFLNKSEGGGKGLSLHQDRHYVRNEPDTLMACWLALVDTDESNGGLCVVPRSHLQGLLSSHKNEDLEEHITWESEHTLRDRDGREWTEPIYAAKVDDLDPATVRHLTVPRGAGVFFSDLLIHGSYSNRSPDRRRSAFATHYVREGTWVYRTDIQDTVRAS